MIYGYRPSPVKKIVDIGCRALILCWDCFQIIDRNIYYWCRNHITRTIIALALLSNIIIITTGDIVQVKVFAVLMGISTGLWVRMRLAHRQAGGNLLVSIRNGIVCVAE